MPAIAENQQAAGLRGVRRLTLKMKRTWYLGISLLLIVALGVPAFSQAPPQPQAKTQAEYNAYKALYDEQNPQKKAELGEKFLTDFKDSDFVGQSYTMLIGAYSRAQNWAKVMEAADRAVMFPKADMRLKTFAMENAMVAAQQANNFEKILEYGDKLLAIDPNNLNAMITLSSMIPERLPMDEAAKKAALEKANTLAMKAMGGVQQVFSQPKPAQITDAQWTQEKANLEGNLHATMGFISLNNRDYGKAVEHYESALKSVPKDGVAHFRLGLAYQFLTSEASRQLVDSIKAENEAKASRADQVQIDELVARRQGIEQDLNDKRDKAIDQLATAVAIGGVVGQPAREALEKLYKTKNNDSTAGLDELIAQKKTQIGTP
jgi:tetratricopeptide (TPR) repeat protein